MLPISNQGYFIGTFSANNLKLAKNQVILIYTHVHIKLYLSQNLREQKQNYFIGVDLSHAFVEVTYFDKGL